MSNSEIDWLSVDNSQPNAIAIYSLETGLASADTHPSQASDILLGPKVLHSTISATLRSEGNDPLNTTFAGARDNGFTADFSLTSDDVIDLERITFTARFNNMEAGESGTLVLRSSHDGFASDLVSVTNGSSAGTTDIPVDLDLSSFTDVHDVTFRFLFPR